MYTGNWLQSINFLYIGLVIYIVSVLRKLFWLVSSKAVLIGVKKRYTKDIKALESVTQESRMRVSSLLKI